MGTTSVGDGLAHAQFDEGACKKVSRRYDTRWKPALLEQLFEGQKRFSELKRRVPGIAQKRCSQQLRELQFRE